MEITTSVNGVEALIVLSGKLTVQTSSELGETINQLPEEVNMISIDLTDVDYMASAGLRILVSTEKLAVKRGGHMHLMHPCEGVMEVFEMTGLSDIFDIEQ